MTKEIEHFRSVTRPNLERIFNDRADAFSEPFRLLVGRYQVDTIAFFENLLIEEERLGKVSGNDIRYTFPALEKAVDGCINLLRQVDKEYRLVLESVDRALLDNMMILNQDVQIKTLIKEYIQGEKDYLHTYYILAPQDGGYHFTRKRLGNFSLEGGSLGNHRSIMQEKIKAMGVNIHRTIRQAVDYINQQERFLEEKLVQQQMQSSGTPQLSSASQDRLPAFAKDDPGLLSLHNMREELLRSLNSITK